MATDPPLRGADQIHELSHALLSVKEVLENPEPRQIAWPSVELGEQLNKKRVTLP